MARCTRFAVSTLAFVVLPSRATAQLSRERACVQATRVDEAPRNELRQTELPTDVFAQKERQLVVKLNYLLQQ